MTHHHPLNIQCDIVKGVTLEMIAMLFEPGSDWRAQRELIADDGSPKRNTKAKAMATSQSYDDLLSAAVGRAPSKSHAPEHESILNP